jgi:transketolase C-terminal domain/subunit
MNKRIQELAEQAGMIIVDDEFSTYGKFAEKLAELIVKECAETIQDFVDHRFPASEYPNRLKKYFGVEE